MKKVIGLIAAISLIAGIASAQVVMSKAQDKSVALRVKNGDTTTLTVVVTGSGTNFAVTVGGQAQTIDGDVAGCDIISELSALVAACTNTSAKKTLTVDANSALAADSTDGEMLDGTYTAAAGKWLELLWDTSAHLSYDIYLPGGEYGSGSYKISKITGCPVGTGNVTLGIYQGGTLIGQQIYTSPVYVNPATLLVGGTNVSTNTLTADAVVNVDWAIDMRNLGGQAVIIRAARATTADAGIISAVIE
jgi:hypothetical protein